MCAAIQKPQQTLIFTKGALRKMKGTGMSKNTQAVESLDAMKSRHSDELQQAMNRRRQELETAHLEAQNHLKQVDADAFDEGIETMVDHLTRDDLSRHHIATAHFQSGVFRELESRFEALEKTTPKGKRGVVITANPNASSRSKYRRVYAVVDVTSDMPGK